MKSIGNKVLVFYYFQLQSNRDFNVTTINNNGQPPTIKEVLSLLPFDLSHGLYHFRFKSELTDGDEKIFAWIDINNITAKVPQVNGSIYMKILKLKDPAHNKIFHLDKLRKADLIKINPNDHHFHSAPKPSPSPNANINKPNPKDPRTNNTNNPNQPMPQSQANKGETKVASQQPRPVTSLLEPAKHQQTISPRPSTPPVPEKPKLVTTSIQENLQTFNKQFKDEQAHRENERLAQNEFEDKIRKWGYTDGKKVNNTTTLLATLHEMWPQWEAVSLTDMLKPEQVTAIFKKAVIKVHPDKNRHRHFKQKYLSKRIFELLNQSRKQT